jgi:tRNA splicing endonuclease
MISKKNQKNFFRVRLWKLSSCKETMKKIITHGIFLYNFILMSCKSSSVFLWIKNKRAIGKGVFSRSEPLFFSPNPCFNSLGKAGREKKILKQIPLENFFSEYLQISFFEFANCMRTNNIFTQVKSDFFKLKKYILKTEVKFYPMFSQFNNLTSKILDLKSGIKFSGNFLIYKKKKGFNFHIHSKAILFNEDLISGKIGCIFCHNFEFQLLDIQNRTRLSAQVSKFNVFSFEKDYYKLVYYKKMEKNLKNEIGIHRFVFKQMNL